MTSVPAHSPLPFSRFPGVYIRDFDEAAALYSRLATPIRLHKTASKAPFSWRSHQFALGSIAFAASEYLGGVSAESEGPSGAYVLSIPLGEPGGEGILGKEVTPLLRRISGLLCSPGQSNKAVLQAGYRGLQMSVPKLALETALTTLTGAAAARPIQFQRRLALDASQAQPFLRVVGHVVEQADSDPAALTAPSLAARLVEALLFRLLFSQPHSQSAVLTTPPNPAETRYVRRAAEYLDVNLQRPITISELTRETGVSARSLQLGFQKHRGCSPLDFLRERRLVRARVLLLTHDSALTVSHVARLAGFTHLGRFSVSYRVRFGESPATTLARRWGSAR
jgi:AraC-like DNA-binding protein